MKNQNQFTKWFDYLNDLLFKNHEDLMIELRGVRTVSEERGSLAAKIEKLFGYQTRAFQFSNGLVTKCPPKSSKKIIEALRKEFGSRSKYGSMKTRKANIYHIPEKQQWYLPHHLDALDYKVLSTISQTLQYVGIGSGLHWNLDNIGIAEAHKSTKGKGATIAIIDTGIDYNHHELKDCFKEEKGYDFVDHNDEPMDQNGHGTHVAGIAAGKTVGVAPAAQLYAVRVLNALGFGSEAAVIYGIEWCINQEVQVINMSLGSSFRSLLEEQACRAAVQKGILIAAAAGNSGYGADYPAAYEGVTAVAAVDRNNEHANFSNIWETNDISAPGVEIYSTYPGGYKKLSGTSMATPHIAGVAALGRSLKRISGQNLEEVIKETAEKVGDTDDPEYQSIYGAGLIRADEVVKTLLKRYERRKAYGAR